MKKSTTFLTATLVALFATSADAKPNYEGLTDSARVTLQSFRSYMKDCQPDKAPKSLSECSRIIKNQRKRLDRIKSADRSHAVFKEYLAYQERLEKAHAARLDGEKKRREQKSALAAEASKMKKAISRHSSTLWFLDGVKKGKKSGVNNVGPSQAKKWLEAIRSLDDFADNCEKTYLGLLDDKDLVWRATVDRAPKPKRACALAGERDALLRAWFPIALQTHVRGNLKIYTKEISDIESSGRASNNILAGLEAKAMKANIAKQVAAYAPTAKALGQSVTAKDFKPWAEIVKKAPKAIKAASKVKRERPTASNAKVAKAAKKQLKRSKLKVKKINVTAKQGKIVKSSVGLPLRRVWSGAMLAKMKGESFCRLYPIEAVADYKGAGRYLAPVVKVRSKFQIAACR